MEVVVKSSLFQRSSKHIVLLIKKAATERVLGATSTQTRCAPEIGPQLTRRYLFESHSLYWCFNNKFWNLLVWLIVVSLHTPVFILFNYYDENSALCFQFVSRRCDLRLRMQKWMKSPCWNPEVAHRSWKSRIYKSKFPELWRLLDLLFLDIALGYLLY